MIKKKFKLQAQSLKPKIQRWITWGLELGAWGFGLFSFFLFSCNTDDFSPKPKGYFRIDLPSKSFQKYKGDCPFTYEFHNEAIIKFDKKEPCWMNIEYPQQNATIHISYKKIKPPPPGVSNTMSSAPSTQKVKSNKLTDTIYKYKSQIPPMYIGGGAQLNEFIEDSRSLVYKHTVKATDIIENPIKDDSSKVYGLLYSLEGNTASSMQFYLTDSVNHFVRGALYFNVATNSDSLLPVIRYIQDDILHLVNSFEWKY